MLRRTNPRFLRRLTGLSLAVTASFVIASCDESDEPAGDQAAAPDRYSEISSASNPDCVRSEHRKVDNETATHLLEAYQAHEAYDYEKKDVAYAAIGKEKMTELTAALDKCAMG